MMEQQAHARPATESRWAPWWVYLGTILGANYLRKAIWPESNDTLPQVAVALAFSAVLFVVITLVYRATHRSDR